MLLRPDQLSNSPLIRGAVNADPAGDSRIKSIYGTGEFNVPDMMNLAGIAGSGRHIYGRMVELNDGRYIVYERLIIPVDLLVSPEIQVLALSVKQPWAWLITEGYKDIENRNWPTTYRGRVYIHASMTMDLGGYDLVRKHFPGIIMPGKYEFKGGGIVGRTTIAGCVERSSSPWFQGPYGWVLKDSVKLELKNHKGQLRFFKVFVPLSYEPVSFNGDRNEKDQNSN